MVRPGGTIDSWCGKCKMILAHTIEAMVGEKPARVQCNTCKAQHTYRPLAPVARKAREPKPEGAPKRQPGKARVGKYQSLLKGKDMAQAKSYSTNDSYAAGDVLVHPSFGVGVATAVKDVTKIEVLFADGPKLLVHGR